MLQCKIRKHLKHELNDLKIIICLRKSEITVERISVCDVIEKLMEHGIHCLSCSYINDVIDLFPCGWSGGAMVLGELPVLGRPTIWTTVGQGPTALAVGAGGGCLDIFTLNYPFFPLSPSPGDGPI